jgi:hypothetical protein
LKIRGWPAPYGQYQHGVSSIHKNQQRVEGWHHKLNRKARKGNLPWNNWLWTVQLLLHLYLLSFSSEIIFICVGSLFASEYIRIMRR